MGLKVKISKVRNMVNLSAKSMLETFIIIKNVVVPQETAQNGPGSAKNLILKSREISIR